VRKKKSAEFCDVFCERGIRRRAIAENSVCGRKKLGLKLRAMSTVDESRRREMMAELGAVTADHLEKTDEQG